MRSKRPDGTLARDVPAYRRVMPYLMRGRNESAVYFEQLVDLTEVEPFLETFNAARPETPATPFHLVAWAMARTMAAFPRMNRFVAGGRLYDRDGIWISYSAKREKKQGSPVIVVKRRFDPDESFADMIGDMQAQLERDRRDTNSHTDRELRLVLRGQGLPLRGLMALERLADSFGILPRSFIDNDPMFASAFIANLGSLKMDAPFHHLFEYGSVSVFCAIGQTKPTAWVVDGVVEPRPIMPLRFTFDERVEDGLYAHAALEHMRALVEHPEGAG